MSMLLTNFENTRSWFYSYVTHDRYVNVGDSVLPSVLHTLTTVMSRNNLYLHLFCPLLYWWCFAQLLLSVLCFLFGFFCCHLTFHICDLIYVKLCI